jgi:cation diffusion facilitator family transporter
MAVAKSKNTINSLKFVLAAYIFVFIIKLVVYFASGVLVVLAEALHTLNDIVVSGFLLGASYYACKQADERHMFGHGRVQNIAAFFAATLFVSITSFKLYDEAIHELIIHPIHHYQHMDYAIAMFLVSLVVMAIPIIRMLMQKKWEATLKAQFVELINDELSIIAALIGTLFILWGYPTADPISTIIVATIIAINAIILFVENLSFLLGRSPGADILARFVEIARSVPGVMDVHDLRAEYIGPDAIHTDMHIRVKRGQTIEDAHGIAEEVYRKVEKEAGCPYCVIHIDPTQEN